MPKITKKTVAAAVPQAERRTIWDTEIKGFGLLVLPSGVKSYVYNYSTQGNRSRRVTIGQSHKLTTDEARKEAKKLQSEVVRGNDPLAKKQANRKAIKVTQLLDFYLASSKFAEKASSTRAVDKGIRLLQKTDDLFFAESLLHESAPYLRIGLYYIMKLMKGAGQKSSRP